MASASSGVKILSRICDGRLPARRLPIVPRPGWVFSWTAAVTILGARTSSRLWRNPASPAGFSTGPWRQGFLAINALVASVPRFVVVLLVASIFGSSSLLLAVVTGIVFAPVLGDAIYARIDQLRVQGFVMVQRAHGISEASILWRHLVWAACRRLIAVNLVHLFAFYLVLECTLSYIGGLGIQEPLPSWGNMMAFEWGRSDVHLMASLAPTLTLWVTMAALAIVAGSVEDER